MKIISNHAKIKCTKLICLHFFCYALYRRIREKNTYLRYTYIHLSIKVESVDFNIVNYGVIYYILHNDMNWTIKTWCILHFVDFY